MPSPSPVTSLRSSDRTPLLFTVNMGLEDVVVDEFRERAAAAGLNVTNTDDAPFGLQSYTLVEVDAAPDDALDVARRMRSVHHVLAPLYTFTLPADGEDALQTIHDTVTTLDVEAMETADTFRASSVRQGEHDFTSVDVQTRAGGALDARYDASVDLEDYDVEVRVDVREDQCLVSVQHTREALSRRQLEGYQPRAALKGTWPTPSSASPTSTPLRTRCSTPSAAPVPSCWRPPTGGPTRSATAATGTRRPCRAPARTSTWRA